MDHVAIMQRSWGLLPKVLSGEKTIESRWYMQRRAPWNGVHAGDAVYFKNGGEPVSAMARVSHVLQFGDMGPLQVRELLETYGGQDGLVPEEIPAFYDRFKAKRYCILVFLEGAVPVSPFWIDKTGFGAQAAWLTVGSIDELRQGRV